LPACNSDLNDIETLSISRIQLLQCTAYVHYENALGMPYIAYHLMA